MNCAEGSELDELLMRELTYEIDQQPRSEFPLLIKNLQRINNNIVSIPSGREDLIPKHYEIIDRRSYIDEDIPEPSFTLYEDQQRALDWCEGSGILNCQPGWGKSICALAIAHKLQMKTLIITTTTTIRQMWVDEIEKFFGFKAGEIKGGTFNIDAPIVVGNIQSVRNKTTEIADKFGTVILDEMHHVSAKTFTETLNSMRAPVKLGLSGTTKRKDGLHVVFEDYFGHDRFVGVRGNILTPEIHLYNVENELSGNTMIPWADKVTALYKEPSYRKTIAAMCKLYAKQGHKVLVLSDRTEMLDFIEETCDRVVKITGSVIDDSTKGITDRADAIAQIENGLADILAGTQSIFSEGVSVPILSCVILAVPLNNAPLLEQIIARVQRLMEGKTKCVAVDIKVKGNTGFRHRNTRKGVYIKLGYPMIEYDMGKLIAETNKALAEKD